MFAADDTFAALETEITGALDIPAETFSGDGLAPHTLRPTDLRGAA